jgi:hypothetical protein
MNPDVKNPRCACNEPGCPDCNSAVELVDVFCGICGKKMTPQNSKLHPEFFVCDACAPVHVCEEFCEVASPQPATAQAGDPCAAGTDGAEVAGEPAVSHNRGNAPAMALCLSGNQVSRSHGAQGDPATAAILGNALAFETAAGISLEELADVTGEGDNGWNAHRRNAIAWKMQRIAAGTLNHFSEDELVSTVARAERGELR